MTAAYALCLQQNTLHLFVTAIKHLDRHAHLYILHKVWNWWHTLYCWNASEMKLS